MPRWRINPGNGSVAGLEADFQPLCPYCKTPLEAIALKLLNFQLNEPEWWKEGEKNAYAIDVECWCPSCGFWTPFGVAVTKDHWKSLHARTERIFNSAPRSQMDESRKHISRA